MSKFLTPPVWYDKNGNLNEMLTGNTATSSDIAIGSGAKASDGGIAIGGTVGNKAYGGIAIGGTIEDNASGGVVIGNGAKVSNNGGIAIGVGAHAIAASTIQLGHNDITYTLNIGNGTGAINGVRLSASGGVIQLGNNNTAYTLNVGNGTGTSKIGALNFNEVASTDIQSNGLYLCTATKTQTVSSETTTFGFSAFLWIETSKSTVVSTTDGSVTFTYNKPEGQPNWAIRVSGADSDTLKCYRVFSL